MYYILNVINIIYIMFDITSILMFVIAILVRNLESNVPNVD